MHSKVIIASLVCMFAATFGNSRTMNVAKPTQFKEPKMSCCNAPNEDGINAVLYADAPYQNNDFCLFLQGLEYQSEMASHMDLLGKSPELRVYPLAYSGIYGYYYNIEQPQNDGDYYARFGIGQKEVATVYIYRSNGICYGSVLSKFDARAKYFKNQVATSSELNYYPDSWGEVKTINSTAAINAIKHYGTYVYSGTSDITMGLSTTQRSGWNDFGSNLSIKVHVEMYKNGTFYPVESARVRLFSSGTEVATGVRRTNSSGNYTFTMNFMDTFNKTLGNLQLGLFTDTAPAIVRDNNGLEYPYIYTSTSSANLFMLKTIQYNIKIYPERSDRAAAYEIAQAELVPYKYTNYYSGTSISNARILFPAEKTTYMTESTIYNVSASRLITIKNNHRDNWDVMNHEYGHYISDMLNLCMDPSNDIYWTHSYNEDLIHTYDFEQGRRIAYSEGLATYLGVAAQLDYATRVNPNSYCATIADEKYIDTVNGVNANFGAYRYGLSSGFYGQGVESSIPSAMIKFLDNVSRNNDNVALGHQKMWNAIRAAGSNTADILTFDTVLVNQNPSFVNAIYAILDIEFIPHSELPDLADWTILFYVCGTCQATYNRDIELGPIPDNVNLVYQSGHGGHVTRSIEHGNGQVDVVMTLPEGNSMGDGELFKKFITWGLGAFPAEKTAVIIENHGQGLNGVCIDTDFTDDTLLNSETRAAFEYAFSQNNITEKLEFICYSACLMQVQDIAEFNAPYFKYQIASEEEMIDSLIPNNWLQDVYNNEDTLTVLNTMVDSFLTYEEVPDPVSGQCISVLDLSHMEEFKNTFDELALKMTYVDNYQNKLRQAINNSKMFGNGAWMGGNGPYEYGLIDTLCFLQELKIVRDENGTILTNEYNPYMQLRNANGEVLVDKAIELFEQIVIINESIGGASGNPYYIGANGFSAHIFLDSVGTSYSPAETHFDNWRSLFTNN